VLRFTDGNNSTTNRGVTNRRQRLLNIALLGIIIVGSTIAATVGATSQRKWVQVSMSETNQTAPFAGNEKIAAPDKGGTIGVYWKGGWTVLPKLPPQSP